MELGRLDSVYKVRRAIWQSGVPTENFPANFKVRAICLVKFDEQTVLRTLLFANQLKLFNKRKARTQVTEGDDGSVEGVECTYF